MTAVGRSAIVLAVLTVLGTACTANGYGALPRAAPSPSTPRPSLAPLTQQELADATLDLPSWGADLSWCPHGRVSLRGGTIAWTWPAGSPVGSALAVKSAVVDLDRDGYADLVAIFGCGTSGPGAELAVGFRRAADGSIQTMGTVAGHVHEIPDLRPGPDGTVDLQASGLGSPVDVPGLPQVLQWRTYHWTGHRFAQSAGPTSFTVSRPELSATVSDLVFGPAICGTRTGTLAVSVHNGGTAPVADAAVVYGFALAQQVTPDCGRWTIDGPPSGACPQPSIAPGATGTLTLTVIAPAERVAPYRGVPLAQIDGMRVQLRVGDAVLADQPRHGALMLR
jgi:hypothetical protein